jgi:hypothetical protein
MTTYEGKDNKDIQIEILKKEKAELLVQVDILRKALDGYWKQVRLLENKLKDK